MKPEKTTLTTNIVGVGDTEPSDATADSASGDGEPDEELVADEMLVEEISIDGMCGVY